MSERAIVLMLRLSAAAFIAGFWGVVLWGMLGCAAATVRADGTVYAAAAAGGTVERCIPTGAAGTFTSAPAACVKVEAQSLPSALFGLLGQAATALVGLVL